ncbi:MAG: hypothetical protein GF411_06360 [Candidatus Lokiarchaeota archaeon]|nr:hypothetical protein [Candidatus Lokiarchaeota archaeon]
MVFCTSIRTSFLRGTRMKLIISLLMFLVASSCYGRTPLQYICESGNCPLPPGFGQQRAEGLREPPLKTPRWMVAIKVSWGNRSALGTGFFIGDGYILTCCHGMKTGWTIECTFSDGVIAQAELVDHDGLSDIVLLKIHGDVSRYGALALHNESVPQGHPLAATGLSYERGYYVLQGTMAGYSAQDIVMQTEAGPWVQGMSGGPIFIPNGDVVGIINEASGPNENRFTQISGINSLWIVDWIKQVKSEHSQPIPPIEGESLNDSVDNDQIDPPNLEIEETPELESTTGTNDNHSTTNNSYGNSEEESESLIGSIAETGADVGWWAATFAGFDPLAIFLASLAGVTGIGVPAVVIWGLSAVIRRWWRKRKEKKECTPERGFLGSRDATEAKEFLRLSTKEGRNPILDAITGRITMDKLRTAIESGSPKSKTINVEEFYRTLKDEVDEMAPLAIQNDESFE